MSKAEEEANKRYRITRGDDTQETSGIDMQRAQDFIEGYHQAEKDLLENKHETSWRLDEKLWKGIKDVEEASYQYMYDASNDWAYDIPTWGDVEDACKLGAKWQKESLWKLADGDDLPEIDREVIALEGIIDPTANDCFCGYKVVFAHRPTPEGYDGKSITTGVVEHYIPETYGEGSWNVPNIAYWLDIKLPKEIEL